MRILLENNALRADLARFLFATGVEARVTTDGVELPTLSSAVPSRDQQHVQTCVAIWQAMSGGVAIVQPD